MKKILLIVFCAILFASCTGVETSLFIDKDSGSSNIINAVNHQFVVGKIEKYGKNTSLYIDNESNNWLGEFFSGNKASFVAEIGLFQIGDTVTVCKFTKINK